jgi:FAD/FMN-containing dehydrogenase
MTDSTLELAAFAGVLLTDGDEGYDDARSVFNGQIDRRPALIARCSNAADVATMVRYARAKDLVVSVYGGGHGVTGSAVCDGGVCIDLRGIKTAVVDAAAKTVLVGGGLTWGELDAATQEHGLAVTGGRVSSTGVGGLALGSGSGWLERKLGFTCDNLLEAEVVTANGDVVTASAESNPDLFWGLRGGGGNFGIVTEFTLRLHEVGPIVYGGMLLYPAAMAGELLRYWRDFMLKAPDEVGSGFAFITAPPEEFVPEPVRGQPVVGVVLCYAGDPEEGRQVLQPLVEFGPPGVAMMQPMPYVAVQQLLDPANPKGLQNYWSGDFFADLPDEAIDTLVSIATHPVSPFTQTILVAGGGAIARIDDDATAFGQRNSLWNIHYLSMWADPADTQTNVDFCRRLSGAMKQWTTGGAYLNFIGDEGPGRVESSFGPEKFARLQALKAKWDPDNLFRHNQNIPPAAGPTIPAPR